MTPALRELLRLLVTCLICAVAGALGMLLSSPTSGVSPFMPMAGVALACVLVWGRRVVPMVGLISFLLHLDFGPIPTWQAAAAAGVIGLGSALQALCGAILIKRFVRLPLTLAEPGDVALFYALGAASCLISATLGTMVFGKTPSFDGHEHYYLWLTWWSGETLGVMLAAPMILTLIGEPSHEWRPRRMTVGATLAIASVFLALGMNHVLRLDSERTQSNFNLEIANAAANLKAQLEQPLNALEAIRSAQVMSDELSRDQFRNISGRWLKRYNQLLALGWSERVSPEGVAEFESMGRIWGLNDFHIHSREEPLRPSSLPDHRLPLGQDVIAIRYIEPVAQNAMALGFNSWSVPEVREAISRSTRKDIPAATRGFHLIQEPTENGSKGVVIYHAVYRGQPTTEEERVQALRGVVFATLRMDDFVRVIQSAVPEYLNICILDAESDGLPPQRLAGPPGCEGRTTELMSSERVSFAGRIWELRIMAHQGALGASARQHGGTRAMSLVALICAGMLGTMLLTVTGRTGRIEEAVDERTAALVQEVRERERAEDALRESEQRFRNIFNIVPIAVAYADLRGKLKQVNPRFCELVGYTNDELMRLNAFDFTHPDDAKEDVDLLGRLVRGETDVYRRTTRYIRKDGGTVSVQCTVSLLRDSASRPRRIVSAVEDISEHLRLHEAERAREAAEAANEAKSDFLSRMSHELRTPLNAMLGFAQLLELDTRRPLAENQLNWVEQIQQAGWHLLDLINEVLDLSRIESGNLQVNAQQLYLPSLLSATIPMIQHEAHRHGIVLTHSIDPDASHLEGDATRVKQILTNLLTNAVKYNVKNGRIHIEARRIDERVHISVTDSGLGMTPEQVKDLFQPFNRLGRDRSAVEGTGIGLVISQRLAELMGGRLKVRSTPLQGTTFTLSLRALSEMDIAPSKADLMPLSAPEYNQRLIHYVEDNETNVEVMRGILSLRPQIKLSVSYTGQEGLDSIRLEQPNVVLLDMHLPDMNGLQVLSELQADPATASIPVIIVSADAITSQISDLLEAGAVRYLTKPVSVTELLAAVDAELEEAQTRFSDL